MDNRSLRHVLTEAGMAAAFDSLALTRPFAIVAAGRPDLPQPEAAARLRALKIAVKDRGRGFLPGPAVWTNAPEHSLFLPLMAQDSAQALARESGQDSFIAGDHGRYQVIAVDTGAVMAEGAVVDKFQRMADAGDPGPGPKPPVFDADVDAGDPRRLGGLKVKGRHRIILDEPPDLARPGIPFFFWTGSLHFAYFVRQFGFAVHDDVPGEWLVWSDKGARMNVADLAVYLPLNSERGGN